MRLAVVGVGNAGSRIVNRILEAEAASGRNLTSGNALLVNSSTPTFDTSEYVPEDRRLVIGDVLREVDGQGIDGDPDRGAEVAREEHNEIVRAFDLLEFHEVDGVLVAAGLAGGTGGGAGAVVIDLLQSICDDPVYAVAVLPASAEGADRALNAARSLQSFVAKADNVLAFDNEAWVEDGATRDRTAEGADHDRPADADVAVGAADSSESVDAGGAEGADDAPDAIRTDYARTNRALAERLVTLFAAGELSGASAPENRMDPSDVMRTLDTGGVSTIGYASVDVPRDGGLHSWLRTWWNRLSPTTSGEEVDEEEPTDAAKISRLVRRAARSKLTLPCEVRSADRALVLFSGPSRALSRKGFESGRYWLEGEADVVDVMAGDVPHDGSPTLTAVVLFSNVTDVPRIDAMQAQAVGGLERPSVEGMQFGAASQR